MTLENLEDNLKLFVIRKLCQFYRPHLDQGPRYYLSNITKQDLEIFEIILWKVEKVLCLRYRINAREGSETPVWLFRLKHFLETIGGKLFEYLNRINTTYISKVDISRSTQLGASDVGPDLKRMWNLLSKNGKWLLSALYTTNATQRSKKIKRIRWNFESGIGSGTRRKGMEFFKVTERRCKLNFGGGTTRNLRDYFASEKNNAVKK